MPNISRGALLAFAAVIAIAGGAAGGAGLDPFARGSPLLDAEPTPKGVTFTKTLIKPAELAPDPQWVRGVNLVVAAHSSEFRACADPSPIWPWVRVSLTATIDEAGRVRSVTQSRLPLGRCVAKKIELLLFEPPPSGSTAEVELSIDLELRTIDALEPTVMGSLDKELVQRVAHANRAQLRYCYEVQLMKQPTVAGKIWVKFVIAATGSVASSNVAQSTVSNTELETCVAARVKTWQFPRPKGGGIVIVMYPFIFSPGGK